MLACRIDLPDIFKASPCVYCRCARLKLILLRLLKLGVCSIVFAVERSIVSVSHEKFVSGRKIDPRLVYPELFHTTTPSCDLRN